MAKFIPFATTNLISKPYTDGYMWVDKETGQIRFDIDGTSVYAAGSATTDPITDYNDLENKPIAYYSDVNTLQSAITSTPLYFKWRGDSETLVDSDIELINGMLYFAMLADGALEINALTGRMPEIPDTPVDPEEPTDPEEPVDPEEPTEIEYKDIIGIPIKVVDSLDIFESSEPIEFPFYFTWTADTLEVSESITLLKHGIYIIKDDESAPVLLAGNSEPGSGSGGGVTDYNDLENKPIKRSNLSSASVLSDGTYYLNQEAGKRELTENPTNVNYSQVDAIYFNQYISADLVGKSIIDMPWDAAVVEDMDGMSLRFLQLIGNDTAENGGRGIYATKIPMPPLGDLYYIIAGVPNFNSEPQVLFQYSADFGPDAMDSGVDAWGWIDYENFELTTKSPLAILEPFAFNHMANKEYWDTWFSTAGEFASSFDFEANTIYRYDDKAFKKIDGNAIEPVDTLCIPSEALNHKVVYNKADNQLYECKELTGATTESPISYETLLPVETTWDSCTASAYSRFFVNTDLSSDTVKAIFAAEDSGTLISVYDYCGFARNISFEHSGDILRFIDHTDSCSPRTMFDSSLGGWQTGTEGWSTGSYAYPVYRIKSDSYYYNGNMRIEQREAPIGLLFAVPAGFNWSSDDGSPFVGYKDVDNIYLNVHEKFDGSKMFADSSQPMLQIVAQAFDKQTKYGLMFTLLDAFGPTGGWAIMLQDWETESLYPLYAEKAFEWGETGVTVTTPGWQSEYVDLTTGKLKVPYNGTISDIGHTLLYLPGEMEVSEDVLGNYLSASPFTKIEGVYTWSKLAGDSEDYMTSSQVQSLISDALVTPELNISRNTERIAALEASAGGASGGPNPTVLAKSNGPINAYDTCSTYGAMYLNRFFADNFDSSISYNGMTLFYGDSIGAQPRIDYTAHTPSSLHIYVYDGSYGENMSGGISQEIYKDGAWVIDPNTYTLSPSWGSWKMSYGISKDVARIISQLFSTTSKNSYSTGVTSADNAWTYIPLADVPDSIVPPNLCDNDFSKAFNYTYSGYFTDTNAGGDKVLYQCIWEGNLTWGSSTHAVRVAFRPIWSNFRSSGPITFTSESIGGNTLTLSSQIDEGGYYPKLVLMLNDGSTNPGGTLYYKRLYVL